MYQLILRLIAIGIVISMFTGCATTDSGRTKAEGTGFGALLGAGIGALAGHFVGGKNAELIGAGIGTAVGAGAGYAAGSAVAERKEAYAKNEDQLDDKINVVAQYNTDLNAYNEQTAIRIKDLEEQTTTLKSNYKKKKVKIAELNKKKDEIKSLISDVDQRKNNMNQELIALNEYRKSISQVQDQAKLAKLDSEIGTLKNNIAMLDNSNKQMARLVKSLTVRK